MKKLLLNLQLFAEFTQGTTAGTPTVNPVNVTTQSSLSPTMKTFYNKTLLENARAQMVFTQFGDKQPLHGKKIEWRKFKTFKKALTPLVEGVIPEGQNLEMVAIEATTTQHGDYTAVSDRLELESFDDVIFGATEEMGAAEGETYDILTRNILVAGNSVAYAGGKASRAALTNADVLTPELVAKAATWLKKNRAPLIDGSYVAIIHPSVAFDLRNSEEWKEFHKYNDVKPIFNGEIGMLHNVRFVECNEAKVWGKETAGGNCAVYATLFFGKKAYGVLEPEGEGMEMIVKPKGTIGGPLEQFSTIGYKFCHGAKILYQERMLRVETGSSYGDIDEEN